MAAVLTPELASRFARIALAHVMREYPNKPEHTLRGPEDARTPRALHPVRLAVALVSLFGEGHGGQRPSGPYHLP